MIHDITFSHHLVDDCPNEIDHAYEAFRKLFPLKKCYVWEDGSKMEYTLSCDERLADQWEEKAQQVIRSLNLPLDAYTMKWRNYRGITEIKLDIVYIKP